jgi:hypothetical protein
MTNKKKYNKTYAAKAVAKMLAGLQLPDNLDELTPKNLENLFLSIPEDMRPIGWSEELKEAFRKDEEHELLQQKARKEAEEHDKQMEKICSSIPKAFHRFIRNIAYDRGHAYGYEEVRSIAQALVDELEPCIESYDEQSRNNS